MPRFKQVENLSNADLMLRLDAAKVIYLAESEKKPDNSRFSNVGEVVTAVKEMLGSEGTCCWIHRVK